MDPITPLATITAALLNLVVQGSPYAILVVAIYVVWGKYQKALEDLQKLNTAQSTVQDKLVNKLLDAVTEDAEHGEEDE